MNDSTLDFYINKLLCGSRFIDDDILASIIDVVEFDEEDLQLVYAAKKNTYDDFVNMINKKGGD